MSFCVSKVSVQALRKHCSAFCSISVVLCARTNQVSEKSKAWLRLCDLLLTVLCSSKWGEQGMTDLITATLDTRNKVWCIMTTCQLSVTKCTKMCNCTALLEDVMCICQSVSPCGEEDWRLCSALSLNAQSPPLPQPKHCRFACKIAKILGCTCSFDVVNAGRASP